METQQLIDSGRCAVIEKYPIDFVVACSICRLRPEEFLVQFVYRFNYSAMLRVRGDAIEYLVNEAVFMYLNKVMNSKRAARESKDRRLVNKWNKKLHALIEPNSHLSDEELWSLTINDIIECILEAGHVFPQVKWIVLPGYQFQLSEDFMVMCYLYGVTAVEVLQAMMAGISLSYQAADIGFGHCKKTPVMQYLDIMFKTYFHPTKELEKAGYYEFFKDQFLVNERVKREGYFSERLKAFELHYMQWCLALEHVPIPSMVEIEGKTGWKILGKCYPETKFYPHISKKKAEIESTAGPLLTDLTIQRSNWG